MDEFEMNIVETKEETDKKCPQCGGVMDFNPTTNNLKCPYCDYEEEIELDKDLPTEAEELDFFAAEHTANKDWGVETKTVLCEACGAESVYDALQTSGVCPFCGSNQVMEAHAQDTIAPGGVVPFKINDKQAAEYFQKWIKRQFFCPKLAKESAKPKSFKGIYLPYWTFDSSTVSAYNGEYGIDKTKRRANGDTYTETRWYKTHGTHSEFIDDELIFAGKQQSEAILKRLEPFDTKDNKPYKPEYIAGFVSERYSIGLKDAWEKAKISIKSKLRRHIEKDIRQEHHADHVRNVSLSTNFSNITYKYLLLPVWISTFKYNDKVYQFMVNGQTGKVSGKTPISIPKVILTVVAVILILLLLNWMGN